MILVLHLTIMVIKFVELLLDHMKEQLMELKVVQHIYLRMMNQQQVGHHHLM